jgi:hypothetical protein
MPYKDPEKSREHKRMRRAENPEKQREYARQWYLSHREQVLARKKARIANLPINPAKKNAAPIKFCQWCKKEVVTNLSKRCVKCQNKHNAKVSRDLEIKSRREKAREREREKEWRKVNNKWLKWLAKKGMVEPLRIGYFTPQQMTEYNIGFREDRCYAAINNALNSFYCFGKKYDFIPETPKPAIKQKVYVRPSMDGVWIQPGDYSGFWGRSLSVDGPSFLAAEYRKEKETHKSMSLKDKAELDRHILEIKQKAIKGNNSVEFFTMLAFASATQPKKETP